MEEKFSEGETNVQSTPVGNSGQTPEAIDPFSLLPIELWYKIISYFTLYEAYQHFGHLSRAWKQH